MRRRNVDGGESHSHLIHFDGAVPEGHLLAPSGKVPLRLQGLGDEVHDGLAIFDLGGDWDLTVRFGSTGHATANVVEVCGIHGSNAPSMGIEEQSAQAFDEPQHSLVVFVWGGKLGSRTVTSSKDRDPKGKISIK